jgi:replicative DNA helicase
MSENVFIPPQNLEAERAVLGGVLLDNPTIADLPAELKPAAFYLPTHAKIFQTMLALWEHEAPIDAVSVSDSAKVSGHEITASLLIEIQDQGMPRSIAYHASLIIAAFRQRKAITLVRDTLLELQQNPQRHDEIMSRLYSANDEAAPCGAMPLQTVMVESLKRIAKAGEYRAIIPTGFDDLDKRIGGIERGEEIVIAGRPSMGKTSFALDLALNAAARGYAVLIVSVETSREKLGMRMLSRETKINSRKFRTGALDDGDYPRLGAASGKLGALPIHVLDREADWENIKREIRRRARGGLDMVVVDYLTLLDLPTGKNDRRDLAVGRVANEAKRLALSLNLGFVLLSQLNRKTEDRSDPEPIMSDLRDSGDIEQAADVIIFPFRPIVYDPDFRPRDKAFLKIAKARDLPTGKIPVRFNAEITSFSDWTEF